MTPTRTCPNCGRVVAFTWTQGNGPPTSTPVCSPISSPECWVVAGGTEAREALVGLPE